MNVTNKLFTTGKFADLCGVKKQTLFHYDDIGLLKPEYKNEKGYRYYSIQQVEILSTIDMLKEIGMSLAEIKDFFQLKTSKSAIELLTEKEKIVEKKILKMKYTQQLIQNQKKLIEKETRLDFNTFTIEEMEVEYLTLSESILNFPLEDITKTIMSFMKDTKQDMLYMDKSGALIGHEQIKNGDYLNYSNLYVHSTQLGLKETYKKKAGKYVIGYHKGSYMRIQETYEKIKDYLIKAGYHISGSSFEEHQYVMNAKSLTTEDNYVTKIMIKVEKN